MVKIAVIYWTALVFALGPCAVGELGLPQLNADGGQVAACCEMRMAPKSLPCTPSRLGFCNLVYDESMDEDCEDETLAGDNDCGVLKLARSQSLAKSSLAQFRSGMLPNSPRSAVLRC